jgi:hypothetical protein
MFEVDIKVWQVPDFRLVKENEVKVTCNNADEFRFFEN